MLESIKCISTWLAGKLSNAHLLKSYSVEHLLFTGVLIEWEPTLWIVWEDHHPNLSSPEVEVKSHHNLKILGSETFARWLVSRDRASASTRDSASASARHRALPYHLISQSFDLPPATTSVSHLTCPLPPHHQSELALALEIELVLVLVLEIELVLALDIEHYRITTSVSYLTCPLPPHQSVIWLAHCHHISHLTCHLPLCHCNTALPHCSVIWIAPTTTSVSHLTCPLPPYQSVIWLAPCYHISQSFDLPTATTSVCHLTCPLPLHQCITTLVSHLTCPPATTSGSHLTCPLPPHHYVPTTPGTSSSSSSSTSTSSRELEIIKKFLCLHHL